MDWWIDYKQGKSVASKCGVLFILFFLKFTCRYDPDKVSQSLSAIRAVEEVSDSSNSADAASNSADAASSSVKEGKPSSLYQKQPRVATPDVLVLFDYPNTKWAVHEANIANIPGTTLIYSL